MAINTYVELDKVTVSGSSTTFIEFLNIPQTYTDLVVKVSARSTNGTILSLDTTFNGDTSNAYSRTYYFTSGSGGNSSYESNRGYYQWAYPQGTDTPTGTFCSDTLYLNNYTSSINPKPLLSRSNQGLSVNMISGQWRSSSAITSIRMALATGTLVAGSTISLYGIKAWANTEASPKATGGYVYSDTNYWYHAFPFSSTFTPNQSITADMLVIAGGGGSGASGSADKGSGGGGAGGLLTFTSQSLTATAYSVTVGAGGARGVWTGSAATQGSSGSNSQFASLTASVGGGGGGAGQAGGSAGNPWIGLPGGSGGGSVKVNASGGSATSGQGNAGGGASEGADGGAGGGGKGGAGASVPASTSYGGNGGAAADYTVWATATRTGVGGYYAGGGGGGAYSGVGGNSGGGGAGAGGAGGNQGFPGLANTGGGGGGTGGNTTAHNGNDGGSGLVIVRYAK